VRTSAPPVAVFRVFEVSVGGGGGGAAAASPVGAVPVRGGVATGAGVGCFPLCAACGAAVCGGAWPGSVGAAGVVGAAGAADDCAAAGSALEASVLSFTSFTGTVAGSSPSPRGAARPEAQPAQLHSPLWSLVVPSANPSTPSSHAVPLSAVDDRSPDEMRSPPAGADSRSVCDRFPGVPVVSVALSEPCIHSRTPRSNVIATSLCAEPTMPCARSRPPWCRESWQRDANRAHGTSGRRSAPRPTGPASSSQLHEPRGLSPSERRFEALGWGPVHGYKARDPGAPVSS